jgi:nitrous oxidase accessory protein NosD
MSPLALAAEEVLSGTVGQVNAREGTFTLRFIDGKTMTLTASAVLLHDLHTGDAVEVRTAEQYVTGLNMKGAGPQLMQPSGVSQRLGFGGPVVPPRA